MTKEQWLDRVGGWYVVEPTTGCWLWFRATSSSGYGHLWSGGRLRLAHRLSYEVMVEPIPQSMTIDHLCRTRCCVNPDHLEAVTMRENLLRGTGVSARHARKTHCPKGHPYTAENLVIGVAGNRMCRLCQNELKRKALERSTPEERARRRAYMRAYHKRRREKEKLNKPRPY